MGTVWLLGSLNIDTVVRVAVLPAPGETVRARSATRYPGGKGANQAVAAAAAGAGVRLIGRVGDDRDGVDYLSELQARGVDVTGVVVDHGAVTGQAVVVVDDHGENSIVVIAGANGRVDASDAARLLPQRGDVVLLQLEIGAEAVAAGLRVCRETGARALVNLSPYRSEDARWIQPGDVVVVNELEAESLAAEGLVPAELVVTRGSRGAIWGGLSAQRDADHVVDTTGAGDAFAGTLAAAIAAGNHPERALERAVAAGAEAVTRDGAQGWAF